MVVPASPRCATSISNTPTSTSWPSANSKVPLTITGSPIPQPGGWSVPGRMVHWLPSGTTSVAADASPGPPAGGACSPSAPGGGPPTGSVSLEHPPRINASTMAAIDRAAHFPVFVRLFMFTLQPPP